MDKISIIGRVLTIAGVPVPAAEVVLVGTAANPYLEPLVARSTFRELTNSEGILQVFTNDRGEFALTASRTQCDLFATLTVVARAPGFFPCHEWLGYPAEATNRDVELRLSRPGSVRVGVSPQPQPGESVTVFLTGLSTRSSVLQEQKCDATGVVLFESVPAGEVWVYHMGRIGYAPNMATGAVVEGEELDLNLESPSGACSASGIVLTADQTPVAGAKIFIYYPNQFSHSGAFNLALGHVPAAESNAEGHFTVQGIPERTYYSLSARDGGRYSDVIQAVGFSENCVLTIPDVIRINCKILLSSLTPPSGRLLFIPLAGCDSDLPIPHQIEGWESEVELPRGQYAVAWQLSIGEGLWHTPIEIKDASDQILLDLRDVAGFSFSLRTAEWHSSQGSPGLRLQPIDWNPVLQDAFQYLGGRLQIVSNRLVRRTGLLPGLYQCTIRLPDGRLFETIVTVRKDNEQTIEVDPQEVSVLSVVLTRAGQAVPDAIVELRREDNLNIEAISIRSDAVGLCGPRSVFPGQYSIWLLANPLFTHSEKKLGSTFLLPGRIEELEFDIDREL